MCLSTIFLPHPLFKNLTPPVLKRLPLYLFKEGKNQLLLNLAPRVTETKGACFQILNYTVDIQEATFSPDVSEDARLVGEVCRKYDRQLVEEGDKGLIDGCGSGGTCLFLPSKPVWAACFHEAATVFVCLGEEELTDTLPFVFSVDGAPHW